MEFGEFTVITGKERSNLIDIADEALLSSWPEFMLHDAKANCYWNDLYHTFPEFQFVFFNKSTKKVIAVGNSIPLVWNRIFNDLPDEGWDWAIEQGFKDHKAGLVPTIQCALSITISKKYRGKKISYQVIKMMKEIGRRHSLTHLIAPVRPSLKCRYPLVSVEEYIQWKDINGLPFDLWLRVHSKLGAKIIKICSQSMHITGTVTEWKQWTGMRFPKSGKYVVSEALVPVEIDFNTDQGTYIEPNVWMCHLIE